MAVYSFSRNLARLAPLNRERNNVLEGLRNAVAGDDAALYNALLLTLRDAAKVPGRKVVIVFSNGPDSASMVAPDDVRAVAEDEGIPIYVISTSDISRDPVSSNVFRGWLPARAARATLRAPGRNKSRPSKPSARTWATATTVTYYPQPNPNEGFRKISVEVVSDVGKKYRISARPGYRPRSGV